jgi:hypothetical protein
MLRLIFLVLVFANGAYYAWAHGWLQAYGFAPTQQSEPQRMAQQITPDAIRVLSMADVKQVEAQVQADLAPKECLLAGPFNEAQADALRSALNDGGLPAGSWSLESTLESARWIIYMGKYASTEIMAKKRAELSLMNLKAEPVRNPALEPGLSLGGFESQTAANAELTRLGQQGIRTAKVMQEREESRLAFLKLPAATEGMKASLEGIRPALVGKPLRKCG